VPRERIVGAKELAEEGERDFTIDDDQRGGGGLTIKEKDLACIISRTKVMERRNGYVTS